MKENVTYSHKREQREREVLEAALDVFAELGFKKTSVEDIATRLDMSPAALYRYASDKRDLYRKAVALGFATWQEAVAGAVAMETDPVGRFRTVCRSAFSYPLQGYAGSARSSPAIPPCFLFSPRMTPSRRSTAPRWTSSRA